jgi:hypothetical protein
MKKYLVLYRSEGAMNGPSVSEMFANTPPEQLAAGMAVWKAWQDKCGSAIIDLGTPLEKSTTVTGGSVTRGKTSITGYGFLQAGSIDEAAALMKDPPHFFAPGASIEILECVPMPGM